MDAGFSRKGVTMKIFNLYGKSMDSTTNKTRCAMAGKTKIPALLSLSLMFMVFTAFSAFAFKDGDSREYIENYMKEQCYHAGKDGSWEEYTDGSWVFHKNSGYDAVLEWVEDGGKYYFCGAQHRLESNMYTSWGLYVGEDGAYDPEKEVWLKEARPGQGVTYSNGDVSYTFDYHDDQDKYSFCTVKVKTKTSEGTETESYKMDLSGNNTFMIYENRYWLPESTLSVMPSGDEINVCVNGVTTTYKADSKDAIDLSFVYKETAYAKNWEERMLLGAGAQGGKAEGTGTGNTAGPNKTGVANTKAQKKSDSETKTVSEKKSDSKKKSVSEKMSGFDDDEDAISK